MVELCTAENDFILYITELCATEIDPHLYCQHLVSIIDEKRMKARNNVSETSSMQNLRLTEAIGFVEEFGIHILLEVTLVGIIDNFLNNTVLSMFVGICIVEGCQLMWRKWRGFL